jgi:serine/threonine protein kinase
MIICSQCLEISLSWTRCDACGGALEGALRVPALDDGYTLDEGPPLGQGSFASVHAATCKADASRWAIKIIDLRRASEAARVRKQLRASFLREVRALTLLKHPHIVGVGAFGARDPDTLFVAMELLPGGQTLQRVLRKAATRGKKPGLNTVLRVLEEVGSALAFMHEQGLIHRDIKPANIGIDGARRFKLLDFGLVKLTGEGFEVGQEGLTLTGWGSYNYGAPEQFFSGAVGPWTDVYALGAIVYEMLAGRPPVCDGTLDRILESMHRPAEPLPPDRERPLALNDLVMQMVEKCPADRPQSIASVLRSVRAIRRSLRAAAPGTPPETARAPTAHLGDSPSPTPSPRVVVLRTRRGDETRPADAAAMELILATKHPTVTLPALPPLDLLDPSVGSASGPSVETPTPPLPRRPVALAAVGLAAIVTGLVGLWFTVLQV